MAAIRHFRFFCLSTLTYLFVGAMASTPQRLDADPLPETHPSPMQDMRLGYFVEPLDKFDRTQLRMTVDSWSNALRSHRFPKSSIQFFHNEGKLLKASWTGRAEVPRAALAS